MATAPGFSPSARPTGGRRKPRTTVMRTQRSLVTGVAAAALVLVLASGGALTASAGGQAAGGRGWAGAGPAGAPAPVCRPHSPGPPPPHPLPLHHGTTRRHPAAAATDAVRPLMASGYLTGLTQYRGSGHGALRGSTLITSSDPPDRFTDDQVAAFIDAQLSAGTVPGPGPGNQTVYGVVMPPWVTPEHAGWAAGHPSY